MLLHFVMLCCMVRFCISNWDRSKIAATLYWGCGHWIDLFRFRPWTGHTQFKHGKRHNPNKRIRRNIKMPIISCLIDVATVWLWRQQALGLALFLNPDENFLYNWQTWNNPDVRPCLLCCWLIWIWSSQKSLPIIKDDDRSRGSSTL